MRFPGVRVVCLAWPTCIVLALCPAALAAEIWIQPAPVSPLPGQEVTLRLYEGDPFSGRERPWVAARTDPFQRVWKKGRASLAGGEGRPPASRFVAAEPGTHVVAYSSDAAGGYCKAVVVIGAASPGEPLRWSEVGQRLELVPQSDPVELLAAGGELVLQALFEREPLAGVRVVAIPEAAPQEGARSAVTDEIGLARLRLDRPGWWLVRVRHRPRDEEGRAATGEELAATLMIAAGSGR